MSDTVTIGLALGGGGARGLAHVVILEAFDDLGIRPAVLSGTSIGAMVGAAYAAGLDAAQIREHVEQTLHSRSRAIRRILSEGAGGIFDLVPIGALGSSIVDGVALLNFALPPGLPARIEDLGIPFSAVATDFYARSQAVLDEGPLVPAIAASIALPGLISPQVIGGRLLIDGGMVNPLPVDQVTGRAEVIVAVDVTGGPAEPVGGGIPSRAELLFASSQIMQHGLVEAYLRQNPADILIRPDVARFRVLDFFKAGPIMDAGRPARDQLKRALEGVVSAVT